MHETWMTRALALAKLGKGLVEPNPMVGCVVVRDGQLIAEGYHGFFGGPHAERVALANHESIEGATLYVTLEPCSHQGKTPPCAPFVAGKKPKQVVVAMEDPFPAVRGNGIRFLRDQGIDVIVGVCEGAARELNAPYLKLLATGRPWVIAKWAMTIDGSIASKSHDSKWITNEASRRVVHQMRSQLDAILVGIETALADDPQLTARIAEGTSPSRYARRIVLDRQARLPPTSQLAKTAREIPVWVVVGRSAPPDRIATLEQAGVKVLHCPNETSTLGFVLDELGRERCTNVMIEGGAKILGHAFDTNLVDQIECFIAPRIIGGGGVPPVAGSGVDLVAAACRWKHVQSSQYDGDSHITLVKSAN
jgi:diaminohydroxyphosphoribosylaminopyrimidine deaminase / 5-amino-6-(5-phosphoribosylamino)uracil reductase